MNTEAKSNSCPNCGHDTPHTSAGIGVCASTGCGCDDTTSPTLRSKSEASRPREVRWHELTREYRVMVTLEGEYEVREVYFDKHGVAVGWVNAPATLRGVSQEDLVAGATQRWAAFTKEVLVEKDLLDTSGAM